MGKISERAAASALTGAETIPVIQGGLDRKATLSQVVPAKLFRNPADYGLVDDSTLLIDQTTALQNYLNAAGTGTCYLPNWRIAFTQIKVRPGMTLIGAGIGAQAVQYGTYLRQLSGSNVSAIVNDPTVTFPGQWMHWTKLMGFRLEKASGHTDTLGSGIEFNTAPGEGMIIEWVHVNRFPKQGIWLADGATPLKMRDLHLGHNGEYGLKLGTSTTKLWSSMYISTVSGDNNGIALIHLQKMQSAIGTLLINHIKSEASQPGSGGLQDTTIHIEDCTIPIEIHAMNFLGITPKVNDKIMIRLTGTNTPKSLSVYGMAGSLVDYLIKDNQNGISVPWNANRCGIIYKDGIVHDFDPTDSGPVLGKVRAAATNADNVAYTVPVLVNGVQTGTIPIYTIASQPAGPMFSDGFETGDTSNWTSTTQGANGSVAVAAGAALDGSYGLSVTPSTTSNNGNVIRKVFKWRTPYLGGKLTINLNTFASSSSRQLRIWRVGAADNSPMMFECYVDAGVSPKQCVMRCADDTGSFVRTSQFDIDTNEHVLEFLIQRASSATANDGVFQTWKDGVQEDLFTNVDLYNLEVSDTLEIGSQAGFTGFSGTFYLDTVILADNGRVV
jgi:hypothetical protein